MMLVADLKPADYGDDGAEVCPNLSHHQIFEKWRVHDTSSAQKLQADYEKDKQFRALKSCFRLLKLPG